MKVLVMTLINNIYGQHKSESGVSVGMENAWWECLQRPLENSGPN